ncbi:MAG TPA: flagellar motor switch protein FliN [Bryobacteraceae bacterium]|nr:flagellar motor switch protein FliN [Bryobacteraceae bacterium]
MSTAAAPGATPPASISQSPTALELLMDMEMPVLIRFGSTRILLRDLLRMDLGSVIEFPRLPNDPVDVIVNGRVVARGEVVMIQGNYGVRVTEVRGTAFAGAKAKKEKS